MSQPVRRAVRRAVADSYTSEPLVPTDISYVDSIEIKLNAVIKRVAQANGATYVEASL